MSDYDEEVLLQDEQAQVDHDGDVVMKKTRSSSKRKAGFCPSDQALREVEFGEGSQQAAASLSQPSTSVFVHREDDEVSQGQFGVRDIPVPPPIRKPVVGGGDRISGDPATRLLGQLTEYFDSKFNSLKKELVNEHEQISHSLEKRLKTSDHEFRRKGNKVQFEHNTSVSRRMQEARGYLDREPPAVQKAVDMLREGVHLNFVRNKHIIIADSTEGGWQTVQEYIQRDVAEDSDDDRRLRRAELSAVRRKQQRWRGGYRGRGRGGSFGNYSFRGSSGSGNYSQPRFLFGRGAQNQHTQDLCFLCGEPGHWKRACPKRGPASGVAVPSSQ